MRVTTWLLRCILCLLVGTALAKTTTVPAGSDLQQHILASEAGDTLLLSNAVYRGNFEINKPLTLVGQEHSILDAAASGTALTITASNVVIKNVTIQNWGDDLTEKNAGIMAGAVTDLSIRNNTLKGDGFGIYLEGSSATTIENNRVSGNQTLRSSDRGNGIHLTNVHSVNVRYNEVEYTRDGLYIINSQQNRLTENRMSNLRFGIHYMYSYNNEVIGNIAEDVDVGYALMSSNNLIVRDNQALRCEDYGLLLNFVNTSKFAGNNIDQVRSSHSPRVTGDEGKALFVYNATGNTFMRNRFANSDMGIHLTAGSEGNQFSENQFLSNETQVKYVSSREQEWSVNGVGNFWSNYVGWDLNDDNIGDSAFEPNDDIDKLLWKYPEARVLMDSPAVLLLRWVQRSFPVLKSPGVKDSYPLYRPQEVKSNG